MVGLTVKEFENRSIFVEVMGRRR